MYWLAKSEILIIQNGHHVKIMWQWSKITWSTYIFTVIIGIFWSFQSNISTNWLYLSWFINIYYYIEYIPLSESSSESSMTLLHEKALFIWIVHVTSNLLWFLLFWRLMVEDKRVHWCKWKTLVCVKGQWCERSMRMKRQWYEWIGQ